ncbi:MAG: NFACT family protein [Oscillospiraceae bacterium]|jgi:predicted ribosome quality control (RQC) complex YloA/Tae2 family protein|nr:NFACT family protein [Oscillospiraceae bacterium]
MPLDGMFLHCLRGELEARLRGARVDKLHHPAKEELVLHLRSRTGSFQLLLCANANRFRANLTDATPENPRQPSNLCMLLRKHFTAAQLTAVEQSGLDRVLCFCFAGSNGIGEPIKLRLYAEFTGRHSNLIAVREDGTILDAIKRVDFTQSALRQVLPGLPYRLPPAQGKQNLLALAPEECLEQLLAKAGELPLSQALLQCLDGVSPVVSRELTFRAAPEDPPAGRLNSIQRDLLCAQLRRLRTILAENAGQPVLLRDAGGLPVQFCFFPLTQFAAQYQTEQAADFSALLALFYREKDEAQRGRQRCAELQKQLQNRIARIVRKLEAQRRELAASEGREELRIWAELILAQRDRLERDPATKGGTAYLLENYYDGGRLCSVPADPARTPAANAQHYFKEYRRAKTAHGLLGGLISQGEQELQYLESVLELLQRAQTQAEIDALRGELEGQGVCKAKSGRKKSREAPLPPLEYESADGLRILVGRSNLQNDRLSFKLAHGNDLWLHAQGCPGSHVILFTQGESPPTRSIEQAAMIAAWHSKARANGRAAVDYTPAKLLKKPGGARPGMVIYHSHQTLLVSAALPQDLGNPSKT